MTDALTLLAMLTVAHFLCDYPLQGPFLSVAKNRRDPVPGFPWYQAMTAHAGIHAGAVWWLTGSPWLGLAEFVAHFIIDDLKCRGRLTVNTDQVAHLACKLAWVAITVWGTQ